MADLDDFFEQRKVQKEQELANGFFKRKSSSSVWTTITQRLEIDAEALSPSLWCTP
jgi:hypothetical protein